MQVRAGCCVPHSPTRWASVERAIRWPARAKTAQQVGQQADRGDALVDNVGRPRCLHDALAALADPLATDMALDGEHARLVVELIGHVLADALYGLAATAGSVGRFVRHVATRQVGGAVGRAWAPSSRPRPSCRPSCDGAAARRRAHRCRCPASLPAGCVARARGCWRSARWCGETSSARRRCPSRPLVVLVEGKHCMIARETPFGLDELTSSAARPHSPSTPPSTAGNRPIGSRHSRSPSWFISTGRTRHRRGYCSSVPISW